MTLVVAGIDLAAGQATTECAILTLDGGTARPRFDAGSHRAVSSDEEIVAVVADACPAVVAIDAPLTLPGPVASTLRAMPGSDANAGANVPESDSPYTRAAERSPLWRELGIRPLPVSFLGGLTFRAIALVPRLRAAAPEASIIEVFPAGTFRQLGITVCHHEARRRKRPPKTSEATRRLIQRGLADWIDGLPKAAPSPMNADLLDALAAALTAAAYAGGTYLAAGDAREGQIILPLTLPFTRLTSPD